MSGAFFEKLKERIGDGVLAYIETHSPFIEVTPASLRRAAEFCREAGFDSLMSLTALDTKGMKQAVSADASAKPAAVPEEIQVVYSLASTSTREKIALKTRLTRGEPRVASVSDIWGIANWHEREAYDMFGVIFEGHPALTRILCPEDWEGWPLRKDYAPPTAYHGVEHSRKPSGAMLLEKKR